MTSPEIVLDLDETEYHAHPALSSTGAKRLLVSPATFDWWRRNPQPPKRAFDVGHAAHAKVLGIGAGVIAYPEEHLTPSGNVSTKAATLQWADEQRAAGLTPVSPSDIAAVDAVAEAVLANNTARALFEQEGHPETSVFATDPDTGIQLRARFDFLPTPTGRRRVAVDLKTTRDASKSGFEKVVARLRYDVQQAHYLHTLGNDPDLEFAFVAVETEPPFHVLVSVLNPDFAAIGVAAAEKARRLFDECTRTDTWPGYPDEIVSLQPPMFHIYDHQDSEND